MPTRTAGQDCDAVLDGDLGLLLVPGTLKRFDLGAFSPAVRASTPRYNDFSLSQFLVMASWHRGRSYGRGQASSVVE